MICYVCRTTICAACNAYINACSVSYWSFQGWNFHEECVSIALAEHLNTHNFGDTL